MKLTIPPIGQRDPKWKLKRLGTSTTTIGSYGCILTAHAMMLTYYGHEFTPDTLNEIYKTKGVFDQGNMINFYAAGNVFDDVNAIEYYNCYDVACDLTKIDARLAKSQPVIALVDFDLNPATSIQTHFVLIVGKTEDGHYLINDPWTGEIYYFDAKYGEPAKYIYGLRIYDGNPKEETNCQDKIDDLTGKVASCNQALSEKSSEVARLTEDLAEQERDNQNLAEQLVKARGERDTLSWEKEQLEIKIKSLQENIEKLESSVTSKEEAIKALKIDLVNAKKQSIEGIGLLDFLILKYLRG
jgi:hypothetical protein